MSSFFFSFKKSCQTKTCVYFSTTEQVIRDLFKEDGLVLQYKGNDYVVDTCVKPRPSSGECKTDIYLKLKSVSGSYADEIMKISVKQTNADFLENKMSLERAEEIFGPNAQSIISNAVQLICQRFIDDYLVCFDKYRGTECHSIKLGWKFEFVNKLNGKKSGLVSLTPQQKKDVYAGTNLSSSKRDCFINGNKESDSGVADHMLIVMPNVPYSAQNLLDMLIPIDKYVSDKNIYFACKALNYRFDVNKWDEDRPLAVHIDWNVTQDGKLNGTFDFDHPLDPKFSGNKVANTLLDCLSKLGIQKFDDLKTKLDPSVTHYK